jgi:hypothetical protein
MPKITSPEALELRSEAIAEIRLAIMDLRAIEMALRRDYRDRAIEHAQHAADDIGTVMRLVYAYKNHGSKP